ncbi:MAG: ATP synthase F1 subunit delta [Desulfobacteraceae bacterium]|nr:ATP synthase F1 subunit delta [Desulfobacteraceae bacterium]
MKNTIVAKRYAKALFAVGREENGLEAYGQALAALSGLIAGQPEVMDALSNPHYPLDVREKVAEQLGKAIAAPPVMVNFLRLVVQKRRAEALPDIAEVFQAMVDADSNTSRGSVVTAVEIDDALKTKIQEKLEKITGKKIILATRVDPSIIGGLIAKVGDLVLDGSIKSQIAGLKESIKGSE